MNTIIRQSQTFRRSLKFQNVKTGEIIDLYGCSAYSQMRKKAGGELLATADCSIDVNNGVVTALYDKDVTATLPLGTWGYDIWLVCDGEQMPIFTEAVTIVKGYTENMGS